MHYTHVLISDLLDLVEVAVLDGPHQVRGHHEFKGVLVSSVVSLPSVSPSLALSVSRQHQRKRKTQTNSSSSRLRLRSARGKRRRRKSNDCVNAALKESERPSPLSFHHILQYSTFMPRCMMIRKTIGRGTQYFLEFILFQHVTVNCIKPLKVFLSYIHTRYRDLESI